MIRGFDIEVSVVGWCYEVEAKLERVRQPWERCTLKSTSLIPYHIATLQVDSFLRSISDKVLLGASKRGSIG